MADLRRVRRSTGFTLLELTITMTLIGLFASAALATFKLWNDHHVRQVTVDHAQVVREAMAQYYLNNSHYPCPAPRVAPEEPYAYGQRCRPADLEVVAAAKARGIFYAGGQDGAATTIEGGVPYRALNIRKEETLDGWGNALAYFVTGDFTALESAGGAKGRLSIGDEKSASMIQPEGSAIWALVSSGPDGSGAYTAGGAARDCDPAHLDRANCDRDGTLAVAPVSLGRGMGYYDDLVWYRTWVDLPRRSHDYCAAGADDLPGNENKLFQEGMSLRRCADPAHPDKDCLYLICRDGRFIQAVVPAAAQ